VSEIWIHEVAIQEDAGRGQDEGATRTAVSINMYGAQPALSPFDSGNSSNFVE
jgi:hypothetical protein